MNRVRLMSKSCLSLMLLGGMVCAGAGAEGVGERPMRWQNRNTPEAVDAVARQFLDMVVLEKEQVDFAGLKPRKELEPVATLYGERKFTEALNAFAVYYTDKLRFPAKFGISPFDVDPFVRGVCGGGMWPSLLDAGDSRDRVCAVADKLLDNVMSIRGKDVNLGAPGTVNWNYPFAPGESIPYDKSPEIAVYSGSGFTPLLHAYLLTRDSRYLDKWISFMDDWSLNSTYVDSIHPLLVPDSSGFDPVSMLRLLGGLAAATPVDRPIMPPRVLAQIMRKIITENVLPRTAYNRSNTHNWTPTSSVMLLSILIDEFKVAPRIFRETRRRNIEDNAVTQNLRDGSENQQCPWYNSNYFGVSGALRLLDARNRMPPWKEVSWLKAVNSDDVWRNEIRDHLKEHATYLIHLRTPQNQWPIPVRGGSTRGADVCDYSEAPEAFADPVNAAILKAMRDPAEGVRPPYTSEWFAYGGYNIIRDGWERDSAHGDLFCSPKPGAYGGFRSRANNNTFGLGAFGEDLLIDDNTFGHYMYPSSPLTVDGKNQFFHAGLYKVPVPAGHKVYQVSAWLDPAPWRWHASDRFNLMEGVYGGPWANPKDAPKVIGADGKDERIEGTMPLESTLRGVTHQRLVLYARAAKLWIVTDRTLAQGEHTYEQLWYLPTVPSPEPAFNPADITVDAAQCRITTSAPRQAVDKKAGGKPAKKANFTMCQFSSAALKYSRQNVPPEPRKDGRNLIWGWEKIGAKWTGRGNQQIVSAILPRSTAVGAPGDFKAINQIRCGQSGVGFEATLPDGGIVRYVASPEPGDGLSLGPVSIKGEALLVSGNTGIALGCSEMTLGGRRVTPPGPDFEFEVKDSALAGVTPIYRPIDPVKIGPDRNVFVDDVEVTLESRTPGVEIHYTMDGSDPTPRSARYTGPFRLTCSAVVKARAYRPGVTENPIQFSGTHGTVASLAVFEKAAPIAAVTPLARDLAAGLNCRYWQADWKTLWWSVDDLKPQATGSVSRLWDFGIIPADNPPVGDKATPRARFYAVEYSGYLTVPADGVYTIHAPRECVWPDTDPGYELRVYLGNHEEPYAYRTRVVGLNEWYPSTRLHALGNWSVPLRKGQHLFRVVFLDYRTDAAKRLNRPNLKDYIWSGVAPDLRISGPSIDNQPIPDSWLCRKK